MLANIVIFPHVTLYVDSFINPVPIIIDTVKIAICKGRSKIRPVGGAKLGQWGGVAAGC